MRCCGLNWHTLRFTLLQRSNLPCLDAADTKPSYYMLCWHTVPPVHGGIGLNVRLLTTITKDSERRPSWPKAAQPSQVQHCPAAVSATLCTDAPAGMLGPESCTLLPRGSSNIAGRMSPGATHSQHRLLAQGQRWAHPRQASEQHPQR